MPVRNDWLLSKRPFRGTGCAAPGEVAATGLPAGRGAIRVSYATALVGAARAALDDASAQAARARFEALLDAGNRT